MNVRILGGGPGGLYAAILLKLRLGDEATVQVIERNRPDDTFGFGVVFSDETLGNIEAADPQTLAEIRSQFSYWNDIDVHFAGEVHRSTGHGFAGLSRRTLLDILQRRAAALDVELQFEREVTADEIDAWRRDPACDLVVAADGVNSGVRQAYADELGARVRWGATRFVWLGTRRRFPAFTFFFKEDGHGLWRIHAYNYDADASTFIAECTEAHFQAAGLHDIDEAGTAAYLRELFAEELDGHELITNRSLWRQFPDVRCDRWSLGGELVILGDAAHTAHFSIGSGTKLAIESAAALVDALVDTPADIPGALAAYEQARRPFVDSAQRAAKVSRQWFEQTELYAAALPPWQLAFSLLTRSLRITHTNLEVRDPAFVADVDRRFAEACRDTEPVEPATPPMFTPFWLRDLRLVNRVVVSPMCQYSADDGAPNDWHLVHLGSRALGGAGLLMGEMTDVSRDGRISPGCTGLYKPEHVPAWRRVTDFVHGNSDAAIGMQLAHAGRKGATRLMWEGDNVPLPEGQGWPLLSASSMPWTAGSSVPKAMDRADMDAVLADFVAAAAMAHEADFDLLEVHLAHGYLLASFLSPLSNTRTDGYGGSLEARCRYPLEVVTAVRQAWPEDKPLSVRISATEWAPGGFDPGDAVLVAGALVEAGVDIIDVSAGQMTPGQRPEYGRLFQTPFSERIRLEAGVPTMTVGAVTSYADVNSILTAGRADLVAIARAHLFDPYWTRHAAFEQRHELPWPPQYRSVGEPYTPRYEWTVRGNEGAKTR